MKAIFFLFVREYDGKDWVEKIIAINKYLCVRKNLLVVNIAGITPTSRLCEIGRGGGGRLSGRLGGHFAVFGRYAPWSIILSSEQPKKSSLVYEIQITYWTPPIFFDPFYN